MIVVDDPAQPVRGGPGISSRIADCPSDGWCRSARCGSGRWRSSGRRRGPWRTPSPRSSPARRKWPPNPPGRPSVPPNGGRRRGFGAIPPGDTSQSACCRRAHRPPRLRGEWRPPGLRGVPGWPVSDNGRATRSLPIPAKAFLLRVPRAGRGQRHRLLQVGMLDSDNLVLEVGIADIDVGMGRTQTSRSFGGVSTRLVVATAWSATRTVRVRRAG